MKTVRFAAESQPSSQPTVINEMSTWYRKGSPFPSSSSSFSSPLISMSRSFLLCLLSQLFFLSAHSGFSSSMGEDLSVLTRGVPLMKRALYNPNLQTFACLDGSRIIPVRQVNDDYCDCKDGSDEPGTSACPQGSFYCTNLQYKPLVIPSSRVNDGICDCCDGTDEWRGVVLCTNICADLGKVLREEAAKEMEMKRAGWAKRLEYSTRGRKENEERRLKLEELKSKKESLKAEKDAAEEAKNEIEAREKEAKDKHEAAWEETKRWRREELRRSTIEAAFKTLDTSEDGMLMAVELHGRHDLESDGDGELSAEEAVALVSDAGVDLERFVDDVWPKIETKYQAPAEIHFEPKLTEGEAAAAVAPSLDDVTVEDASEVQPAVEVGEDAPQPSVETLNEDFQLHHEEDDGVSDERMEEGVEDALGGGAYDDDEENDDFRDEEEDQDEEEEQDRDPEAPPVKPDAEPSNEFAAKDTVDDLGIVKPDYDEDAREKIRAADAARASFNEVDTRFRDLERDIHDLDNIVGLDLGRAFEFASLHGHCFEYTDREYTYKLCMYDRASQRPKDGGGEASLGTFSGWENDRLLMKYENGQGCWNGPSRSAKVVLSCGVEDQLTAVSEPSRCEYDFRMTTPAVCEAPEEQSTEERVSAPPDSLKDEL